MEKKYTTKNGQEIVIRAPHKKEAQALIDLKLSYIANTQSIPMEIEEYNSTQIEEENLIEKYQKSENSILLVVTLDSKFIGNIDLTGSERKKMFHTGMIGMGIKEEFRNMGVGTFLMKEVLDWAKQNAFLEIIWLDVYASNELGLNLYKKMNFKISGIIEGFFREGNSYYDKIQMYQRIK